MHIKIHLIRTCSPYFNGPVQETFFGLDNANIIVIRRTSVLYLFAPFCWATDCSYFELRVTLPMGFKARVVLSPAHLLACGEHKGHVWCYTAFSTKRDIFLK